MSLAAQTECLDTEEELLCGKGVESGAEVSLDLDSSTDNESDRTERVVELQAMVALRGVVHLREPFCVLGPIKLAAVDDYATDGGAMTCEVC